MRKGFITQTLISVYCTTCGEPYEVDDAVQLFISIYQAVDPMNGVPTGGWTVDDDEITCNRCIERAYCAEHGHARPSGDAEPIDLVLTAVAHLLGGLLSAVFVTAWWALLFPMISAPIALSIAATLLLGWPIGVGFAVYEVAVLILWRVVGPNSFRRWITDRARMRFLRWFRYRRRWARLLTSCKLTAGDADALYVPRLRSVVIGEHIDRVRVRMLDGQAPEDYHIRAVRLAHAFGAQECRAIDAGPSVIELVFRYSDPLADTIVLPSHRLRTLPRHLPTRKDAA